MGGGVERSGRMEEEMTKNTRTHTTHTHTQYMRVLSLPILDPIG